MSSYPTIRKVAGAAAKMLSVGAGAHCRGIGNKEGPRTVRERFGAAAGTKE